MKLWIRRIALFLSGFIVLAIIVGCCYEAIGRRNAARDFPPPGKMVDIGGRRIQLDCRGSGSPVVVFESGLDIDGSLSWSAVQDSVAKTTRACTYSRAGIMWSDPLDGPQNGKSITGDLHAALDRAGERPPFVLVGHSLGGPYIMTFTKYFGMDVAGLVFVDASHPEQVHRFKTVTSQEPPLLMKMMNKVGAALAWTGVVRAALPLFPGVPHQPAHAARARAAYASTSLAAAVKETDALDQTLAEAGTFRQLGNRPLFMLTSMAPLPAGAQAHIISLSLLLGGGVGNLIDRVFNEGRVIDFMNIGIGSLRTGVFNVADIAISCGAVWLCAISFKASKKKPAL